MASLLVNGPERHACAIVGLPVVEARVALPERPVRLDDGTYSAGVENVP